MMGLVLATAWTLGAFAQEPPPPAPEPPPPLPQPPPPVPQPPPAAQTRSPVANLNPDLSFIADVALAGFTSTDELQTGAHDPQVNGFNLQALELAVGKAVDPYFRFDSNIVFEAEGVEIEEVYATTLALPARFQVRAGQFLTRFGRINGTHPHSWDFADQPFSIGRVFGSEGNRGLGTEVSWLAPLPWSFEVALSETMIGEEGNRSWEAFVEEGVHSPLDLQTTVDISQFFALGQNNSLMWGLSWANGKNGLAEETRTEVVGTDVYFKNRPIRRGGARQLTLQSEVLLRRQETQDDVVVDLDAYSQVSWRFLRRWAASARHEVGTPEYGADGELAAVSLDPEWTSTRNRVTVATTFFPTEFSRLRLQGSRDMAAWIDGPAWTGFLTFEFLAGAHGSHTF